MTSHDGRWMTIAVALLPLLLTPLVAWLLMEYGPERSVVFAAYWLVLSIVFAIAMPLVRRRGRSLAVASVFGALIAVLVTVATFAVLLFALTPHPDVAIPIAPFPPSFLDSHVPGG